MDPVKRNLALGVSHEALWGASIGLVNPYTILPLAAHDLGRGVADTGLLVALLWASYNLTALPSAFLLSPAWTRPRRTARLHLPCVAMTLASALAMASGLDDRLRWPLLVATVALHWLLLGVVTPHWASLSSRNVPPAWLGRYFGWAFAASGLCTVFTGVWAARLAAAGGTRWGYTACFGGVFALQMASLLLLAATRPLAPEPDPAPPLGSFLAQRWDEARRSRVWMLFCALTVGLQFCGASTQLFANFLRDHGFSDASFEAFNPAWSVGGMLGSVSLGWLMDRRGPSAALRGCLVALCCALGLLLFAPHGLPAGAAAMACAGLFNAAFGSVMLPWMLRLARPGQQPAFAGLYGTLTAPWNFFAPWALGRLAQSHGYGAAFSVSATAAMAALLALALVPVGKDSQA